MNFNSILIHIAHLKAVFFTIKEKKEKNLKNIQTQYSPTRESNKKRIIEYKTIQIQIYGLHPRIPTKSMAIEGKFK